MIAALALRRLFQERVWAPQLMQVEVIRRSGGIFVKLRMEWGVARAIVVVMPSATVAGPAAAGAEPQVLLPLPGDTEAMVSLINDAGQAVGSSRGQDNGCRSVQWEADLTPTRLGLLEGGTKGHPAAIAADGSVSGQAKAADKPWHSAGWGPTGAVRRLPEPAGYLSGNAEDINGNGFAVGTVSDNWGSRVVRWNRQGRPELLPVAQNHRYSQALFVDQRGNSYGWMSYTATSGGSIVRWDPSGNITTLDAPGSRFPELRDLNDRDGAVGATATGDVWQAALALPGRTFAALAWRAAPERRDLRRHLRHGHRFGEQRPHPLGGRRGGTPATAARHHRRPDPVPQERAQHAGTVTGSSSVHAVTWDATGRPSKLPVPSDTRSSFGLTINRSGHVNTWSRGNLAVVWR
ncbi:hypothetical protein ACWD4K_25585 [Streptomyces gelaticus]